MLKHVVQCQTCKNQANLIFKKKLSASKLQMYITNPSEPFRTPAALSTWRREVGYLRPSWSVMARSIMICLLLLVPLSQQMWTMSFEIIVTRKGQARKQHHAGFDKHVDACHALYCATSQTKASPRRTGGGLRFLPAEIVPSLEKLPMIGIASFGKDKGRASAGREFYTCLHIIPCWIFSI